MESNLSLVYLAKPIYGGWVTYTSHLVLKYNFPLYKVTKRTEKKKRQFGYGVDYQNIAIEDLVQIPNLCIVAVDKHYWHLLDKFPTSTKIVIHDPTELKPSKNGYLSSTCKSELWFCLNIFFRFTGISARNNETLETFPNLMSPSNSCLTSTPKPIVIGIPKSTTK